MPDATDLKYERILIKLSGEAFSGNGSSNIDPTFLKKITAEIRELIALKVQVAIVIGGGNFFRGVSLAKQGVTRITGDHMGMIATMMNALVLRDAFEQAKMPTRILSALPVNGIIDGFNRRKAMHHLESGRIVIFAGGTGSPLVTTDSAASLRAIEIEADVLLKATNVDGVYSADPIKEPQAVLYDKLTYDAALKKELAVMDLNAFCQCRDFNMPIRVFNINKPGVLLRVVMGANEGTLVSSLSEEE